MTTDKQEQQFQRPMKQVINLAVELGYISNHDPFIINPQAKSKFEHCLAIKDWLMYKLNIFTWVIPHKDFTFTPYYKDLRTVNVHPKKGAPSENYMQSTVEGLYYALKSIK